MGGFNQLSGPVIAFTFDESSLVESTQAALQKIQQSIQQSTKQNSQQIISQISNPPQEQAARLRALFSTGAIGLQQLQVEQKKLLGLQDQEINSLLKKEQLTKSELSTLKQITLERERQANAISRGTGVGVTSGTQSALGLVTGNITRNISQLGARLVGVSGGSGAETAILSGAAASLTEVAAAGGPAVAVLGAVAAAALAAVAAETSLAISGGKIVENFNNISKITGISTGNLQVLDVLAQSTGNDLDSLVVGFKKFAQALTGGASGDAGIDGGGKRHPIH
jgi:hypothetical protein